MTTNRDVYEGKILETLIKNSERLAVAEQKLISIETKINWLFGAVFAVGFSILATLYAQPILNALN